MGNNLSSPNSIATAPELVDLNSWFAREIASIEPRPIHDILAMVGDNIDALVRFPARALLLWNGCDRIVPEGKKTKYHQYPDAVKRAAKANGVYLDARANGPAIAAFQLAGGERPGRHGSSNAWSVHHLYSGKFPLPGHSTTIHAAKSCIHFTESAGLVAVHPVADALCDESPALTWLLRAEAFRRFGYDPDGAFSGAPNAYGFAHPHTPEIVFAAA